MHFSEIPLYLFLILNAYIFTEYIILNTPSFNSNLGRFNTDMRATDIRASRTSDPSVKVNST